MVFSAMNIYNIPSELDNSELSFINDISNPQKTSPIIPGMQISYPLNEKRENMKSIETEAICENTGSEDEYNWNQPRSIRNYENSLHSPDSNNGQMVVLSIIEISHNSNLKQEVWNSSIKSTVSVYVSSSNLGKSIPGGSKCASTSTEECSFEFSKGKNTLTREFTTVVPKESFQHFNNRKSSNVNIFSIFIEFDTEFDIQSMYLETAVFIQYLGQIIKPIKNYFHFDTVGLLSKNLFLGSVSITNEKLAHHSLVESSKFKKVRSDKLDEPRKCSHEFISVVSREDMVQHPSGARGGRPIHRITGELLMTKEQVEKVLEIRERWEGLSHRQRKDNVREPDLYPFLTINRDETAECLSACPTWLKDVIRSQGMNTWPGRPLRKTGTHLQNQKELLDSAEARLNYTARDHPEREIFEYEVQRIRHNINDCIKKRMNILKIHVSQDYYDKFVKNNGKDYLNPRWEVLPPCLPSTEYNKLSTELSKPSYI